ncbi:MAG: hypothetical protein Q9221_003632 [Calogaya cf. arnoldii]
MLLKSLSSWLLFLPLLTQAVPVIKPRVVEEDAVDSEASCIDHADCGSKGYQLLTTLHETLFRDVIIDRNDKAKFEERYLSKFWRFKPVGEKFHLPLRNRGIEVGNIDHWRIWGKDPKTGVVERPDKTPYINFFDTKNGILIADQNFRGQDTQQALPWSELMYQTWALVNTTQENGGPISNLRSIARSFIVNRGTKAVFELAYEKNKPVKGEDGEEEWREWTESSHQSFFYDMLATDNIKEKPKIDILLSRLIRFFQDPSGRDEPVFGGQGRGWEWYEPEPERRVPFAGLEVVVSDERPRELKGGDLATALLGVNEIRHAWPKLDMRCDISRQGEGAGAVLRLGCVFLFFEPGA